jgi:hypothetical protein
MAEELTSYFVRAKQRGAKPIRQRGGQGRLASSWRSSDEEQRIAPARRWRRVWSTYRLTSGAAEDLPCSACKQEIFART